jgi:hypothetical protein
MPNLLLFLTNGNANEFDKYQIVKKCVSYAIMRYILGPASSGIGLLNREKTIEMPKCSEGTKMLENKRFWEYFALKVTLDFKFVYCKLGSVGA